MVRAVFDSVAPKYDLMNDVMSLGIHRAWKRIFATRLRPAPQRRLLDLASGTGDIAQAWRRMGGGPVLLTDINAAMLGVGRDRAIGRGFADGFSYAVADAEALPLPDGCVDTVSIAFGLRNCTDKLQVLREARRVLKPGGALLLPGIFAAADRRSRAALRALVIRRAAAAGPCAGWRFG